VYQCALVWGERMERNCKLAYGELSKVQVLVLIPDAKRKLDFIWRDPAEIIVRHRLVNYCIKFGGGAEGAYHINMLKHNVC
jgi:hypothetical protein